MRIVVVFIVCATICGQFHFVYSVVNGDVAGPGDFPWYVSIDPGRSTPCGGSLITARFVITAANCLRHCPSTVKCYLGAVEQWTGRCLKSRKYYINPHYDRHDLTHDIALIKLPCKVEFSSRICPVKLARKWMYYSKLIHKCGIVTGTGSGDTCGRGCLKYTEMEIVKPSCCEVSCGRPMTCDKICASSCDAYTDECTGDAGSGLVYKHCGIYYLIGIDSYGNTRCNKRYTTFQSIVVNKDWIGKIVGYKCKPHC